MSGVIAVMRTRCPPWVIRSLARAASLTILLVALASCGTASAPTSFELASGVRGQVADIQFLSGSEGWMSVLKQPSGHLLIQLFKSTNGGALWTLALSSPADGLPGAGWFHFFSRQQGVVVGSGLNQVLETSDGGLNWVKLTVPSPVMGPATVSFLNLSQAWALSIGAGAMGSEEAVVYHTSTGAAGWKAIARTPSFTATSQPAAGTLPVYGDKNGIYFRSDTTGWVTGAQAVEGYPWLYMSTDGGRTWKYQSLPLPKAWSQSEIMTYNPIFTSPTEGILPVADNSALYICRTTDGGATWGPPVQVLPTAVSNNQHLSSFIDPESWVFLSSRDGFAVFHNAIWITADGGQLWQRHSLTSGMWEIVHLSSIGG